MRSSARSYEALERIAHPPVQRVTSAVERFGGRTLREIIADPTALDPPVAILPRLGWRSRVTLLSAQEKVGKSTLLAAAAR